MCDSPDLYILTGCSGEHPRLVMAQTIADTIRHKMGIGPDPIKAAWTAGEIVERRGKVRICECFPVKVRGVDATGEPFEIDTALDNLSTGGLYMRLARHPDPGARLLVVIHLSHSLDDKAPAPRVAALGEVLRIERQPYGSWGVAVKFMRHRFL